MNTSFGKSGFRRNEHGFSVLVIMVMLGIMMTCVAVNLVAIRSLDRELKLVDKQQRQRLEKWGSHTNSPISVSATVDTTRDPRHD